MARRRTGWSRLSKASRDRLVAAGRTGKLAAGDSLDADQARAYWEAGGDLSAAYGHPRKIPGRAPVFAAPLRISSLAPLSAQQRLVQTWTW